MNVHLSLSSLACAAALTAWIAAVAASASAPPDHGGELRRDLAEAAVGREGGQPPPPPAGSKPDQPGNAGAAKPAAPVAPAAPRPAIPAAASSIADRPAAFIGQNVSVYATVEQQLAPTVFTIDQDPKASTGKEVLVISRRLHEQVEPNAYVTVMGEVVRADAAEIAKVSKEAAAAASPELLAKYAGKPVIIANAVVTAALIDIARFIPPPMTPEEAMLDKAMKAVGPANGALRKGVDGSNVELVKTNTDILAKAFADTEAFWRGRNNPEAIKIAQTARGAVDAIAKAAASGNWNEAKTQNTTLGQQCASCHKTFRERLEDGSFAVRRQGGR